MKWWASLNWPTNLLNSKLILLGRLCSSWWSHISNVSWWSSTNSTILTITPAIWHKAKLRNLYVMNYISNDTEIWMVRYGKFNWKDFFNCFFFYWTNFFSSRSHKTKLFQIPKWLERLQETETLWPEADLLIKSLYLIERCCCPRLTCGVGCFYCSGWVSQTSFNKTSTEFHWRVESTS